MDIQALSVDMNQENVQEQAAIQVQAMAVDTVKQQAEALNNIISTVPADPNLGQKVDLTA